jgi:hypothetical protein
LPQLAHRDAQVLDIVRPVGAPELVEQLLARQDEPGVGRRRRIGVSAYKCRISGRSLCRPYIIAFPFVSNSYAAARRFQAATGPVENQGPAMKSKEDVQ